MGLHGASNPVSYFMFVTKEAWPSLAYGSCLENNRGFKTTVGSNPTAST